MSNANSPARQPGAGEAAEPAVTREAQLTSLRAALYSRGVALAKWRVHRAICGRCLAIVPPAGPVQCCRAGGRLLTTYLRARQAAIDAHDVAYPRQPVEPLTLF